MVKHWLKSRRGRVNYEVESRKDGKFNVLGWYGFGGKVFEDRVYSKKELYELMLDLKKKGYSKEKVGKVL